MPRISKEHTDTFSALATDGSHRQFVIHVFTEFHEGRTSDGPYRVEGRKSLETEDGDPVDRKEKGRYTVITGLEEIPVTSDDPNAP